MNNYEPLKKAVVMQAVRDYRQAICQLQKNPNNTKARMMKQDCETFFLSKHFSLFTDLNGEYLLARLSKEVA